MEFTPDELLVWASRHEEDDWSTLHRKKQFRYRVTSSSIVYIPGSGIPRNVPRNELAAFCKEFQQLRSYAPGAYPHRWHKSYSLPIIKRFLHERRARSGRVTR